VLRPREPFQPLEPDADAGAKDPGHEFFTQGSFTCPKADAVVVLRLTPALLASLGRTGNHPSPSGHSLGRTGNHPSPSGHPLGAHSTGSHSTGGLQTGGLSNSMLSTTGGHPTGALWTGGDPTLGRSTLGRSTLGLSTGAQSTGPQWAGGHPTKGHGSTDIGELLALAPASTSARKSRSSALAIVSFGRRRLATATTSPQLLHDSGYSCTLLNRERPVGMAGQRRAGAVPGGHVRLGERDNGGPTFGIPDLTNNTVAATVWPWGPGYWAGRVRPSTAFDELPEDVAAAFRGEES
jgi:hypothetical protein